MPFAGNGAAHDTKRAVVQRGPGRQTPSIARRRAAFWPTAGKPRRFMKHRDVKLLIGQRQESI